MRLSIIRAGVQAVVLAAACLGTTGCWFHRAKAAATPPLPPPVTVPLEPTPEPATPPQVASVPETPAPLPTQPVQPKVKKPKKKVDPAAATPAPGAPVEVASAGPPPAESVIGALTAGGDASPAQQQKATDAIATVEKRLAEVPAATLKNQEDGVKRVQNFLRQAHEALKMGDAEGAMTLATKAKVLLDDLLK